MSLPQSLKFPLTLFICLLIISCNQKKNSETDAVGLSIPPVSWAKGLPEKMRELQEEGSSLYVEEDCFCSRRIINLDRAGRKLIVHSWCSEKESDNSSEDSVTLEFKKAEKDMFLFERKNADSADPYFCSIVQVIIQDSLVQIGACSGVKRENFVKMPVSDQYPIRKQDCEGFGG